MAIFNSYVSLPKGNYQYIWIVMWITKNIHAKFIRFPALWSQLFFPAFRSFKVGIMTILSSQVEIWRFQKIGVPSGDVKIAIENDHL